MTADILRPNFSQNRLKRTKANRGQVSNIQRRTPLTSITINSVNVGQLKLQYEALSEYDGTKPMSENEMLCLSCLLNLVYEPINKTTVV